MRFSRTDLAPVLVIVAGGAIGALLTFSPLMLFSRADQVPAPVQPAWSPSEDVSPPVRRVTVRPRKGRVVPVWSPDGQSVVFESVDGRAYRVRASGGDPQPVEISPDGQWIVYLKGDAAVALYGAGASDGVIRVSVKGTLNRR